MTDEDVPTDDEAPERDPEPPQRRSDARDDVIKLTLVGVILVIVGGLGTWFSKWDTGTFSVVEVADDRFVAVEYDCNASTRLVVDAFDDEVQVRLLERRDPSDDDCQSFECFTLDRPLAGRRVVNAGTDTEVFVAHVETLAGCPGP